MDDGVVVFHPGTQHSWQTALALQELGRLRFYATSIFHRPERWPYRLERHLPAPLARALGQEFRRFSHPGLDPALVRTFGIAEWLERAARRANWRRLADRIDRAGNRGFARALGRALDGDAAGTLWGYNGTALDGFRNAKAAGRRCVLDRTIGDWRAYHAALAPAHARYPDYFPRFGWRVPQAAIDRDDEEYALADVILAGSPVAAGTVRAHARDPAVAARVRVLPYCFDHGLFGALPRPVPRPPGTPLRLLFLGQVGVRKGIHLLLNALARIPAGAATLTVVGDLQVPRATWARHADRVRFHPTIARAAVPALMQAHDILVFPSYFEGSALSLLEALAAGMGLIQSEAAGLGVTPETGLLLPELSENAVEAAIVAAIRDPARVEQWRRAAQGEARRYAFARYRAGVAALLADV